MAHSSRISDEQARALWQRAAELQAAADHTRALAPPPDSSGLMLSHVAQAAEGAGIHPDYVRVAYAETQLHDADRIDRDAWSARWLRRLLRQPDAIEASLEINATPAAVLDAVRSVTAAPNYSLAPEGTHGDDPLRDAVLVYRVTDFHRSPFGAEMNWADVRVLLFTIRPEGSGTRLRVRAPLYRRGVNLALGSGTAGVAAAGGAAAGGAVGSLLPSALGAAAVAPPVALGLAGAVIGVRAYRWFYRSTHRGGQNAILSLLRVIAQEASG